MRWIETEPTGGPRLQPGHGGCMLVEDPERRWRAVARLFPFGNEREQAAGLVDKPFRFRVIGVEMIAFPLRPSTELGRDLERRVDPGRDYFEDNAIDVATWRSFPLAEVETTANLWEYFHTIVESMRSSVRSERDEDDYGEPIADWSPAARTRKPTLPKRPERGRYPDAFYERLAALYRYHVGRGDHPAQQIAADEMVPASTVHRWIREARRRGTLGPAGAKGRAG